MFASRSDALVRISPKHWIAALTFGLFLISAIIPVSGAFGAAATAAKADTAADEGISVRVVEDGKTTVRRSRSIGVGGARLKVETAGKAAEADIPEPPEPPDVDSHANDLVRFGQDIEIPADKVIDGDVVAIGGSVTVYGRVKGDCVAVGGSVSIRGNGAVEGDAVSVGGATNTSDSASVAGSNVSVGAWPFKGPHGGGLLPLLGFMGFGALAGILTSIVQFILTLFFAWLCLVLVRERMEHAVDVMGQKFGKSFLWGLLGWVAMLVAIPSVAVVGAVAIVILVITIIGIPVAILLAIALVFALIATVLGIIVAAFLGYVNGAMYLGRRLLARLSPGSLPSPLKAVAFGIILIMGLNILGKIMGFVGVVFLMPVGIAFGIVAAVLGFVFSTAGLGAMVITRFSRGPEGAAAAAPSPVHPGTSPAAGWYEPPPPPPAPGTGPAPASRPGTAPEGGTSDAP